MLDLLRRDSRDQPRKRDKFAATGKGRVACGVRPRNPLKDCSVRFSFGFNATPSLRETSGFHSRDRNLTHVHYLSATDEASPGQARFHEWLTRHGFLVHTQRLEQRVNRVRCPTCTTDFDPVCPTCQTVRQLPPHKSKMTDIDL